MLRVLGIGLLGALLSLLLRELDIKNKKLLSAVTVLVLFAFVCEGVNEIFSSVSSYATLAGVSEGALSAVKIVGVGYLFGFSSEICAGLGEGEIANALTLVGRVETVLVALPYFEKTLSLGVELLK